MPKMKGYWANPEFYRQRQRERVERLKAEDPEGYKQRKREESRRYYERNKDRILSRSREYDKANPGVVIRRQRKYKQTHKDQLREAYREWCKNNPDYHRVYKAKNFARDQFMYLLAGAKQRAKKAGLPFDLTLEDLTFPDICPVLGIEIEYGGNKGFNPRSPSLDRIIPELGYVRGNVNVISYRANELKKDATAAELRAVADYIEHG